MADLPRGTVTFLFTDATANALALINELTRNDESGNAL
jgi:hypothetical protein